jgi:hypothetical protein
MREPPFVIEQSVAGASSEVHSRTATCLEASRSAAIRRTLPRFAAVAILSDTADPTHRVRASLSRRSNHEQSSPHNKRLECARVARPTRKSASLLLAAQPRRWA